LPLVWIPALNLLGPAFFTLEMHSIAREGPFPRPDRHAERIGHGRSGKRIDGAS
jgi:hypothetical protein